MTELDWSASTSHCGVSENTYNILNHSCSATWYGALLNNDGARPGVFCNSSGSSFDCTDIRHGPGAQSLHLGGCVDADKDDVCFGDGLDDIGGKDEIRLACLELNCAGKPGERDGGIEGAISGYPYHLQQPVLVYGEVCRVPRGYALLVQVDDVDQDLRVVICDHGGSWSSCCHVSSLKTIPGAGA